MTPVPKHQGQRQRGARNVHNLLSLTNAIAKEHMTEPEKMPILAGTTSERELEHFVDQAYRNDSSEIMHVPHR